MDLPKVTQEPLIHIDMTPGSDLPIRILEAYRANCNCKWEAIPESEFVDFMNKLQDERAEILDKAIKILKKYL